jgi:hypothetical protein
VALGREKGCRSVCGGMRLAMGMQLVGLAAPSRQACQVAELAEVACALFETILIAIRLLCRFLSVIDRGSSLKVLKVSFAP